MYIDQLNAANAEIFKNIYSWSWTLFPFFLGYPALERLFLASNQISRVSLQALADMPSLVELDLSDNKLIADAIDGPIFDLPNLKILNLSHNKLAILNDQLLTTLNR